MYPLHNREMDSICFRPSRILKWRGTQRDNELKTQHQCKSSGLLNYKWQEIWQEQLQQTTMHVLYVTTELWEFVCKVLGVARSEQEIAYTIHLCIYEYGTCTDSYRSSWVCGTRKDTKIPESFQTLDVVLQLPSHLDHHLHVLIRGLCCRYTAGET